MVHNTPSARYGSPGTGAPGPTFRSPQKGIFRKQGEYWTIGHGGNAFLLRDTRGLGYLAHLLRNPTAEFHVLDLVARTADHTGEGDSNRLPRGDEELEKAGIHLAGLGDAGAQYILMTRWVEGEMSAESIGQTAFPGVASPRDAKPTHPGALAAPWTKTGPNWDKTLPREAGWSKCGVEIGEAKRKFRSISSSGTIPQEHTSRNRYGT